MCATESTEVGVFGESQFSDDTIELSSRHAYMCAAKSTEVGVFGESQFSDATVELFSRLSCFQ